RVDVPPLDKYDWVIFTSVNAVEIFYERLRENGKDVRTFGGIEICAVGPKTVEALNDIGIQPDFVPTHSRGSAIAAEIEDISGKKILLPRAKIATADLPKGLRDRGAHVNDVPLYDTVKVASDGEKKRDEIETDLLDGRIDLVTFTSSSTVTNFLEMFPAHPKTLLADVQVAVIGPETQKTAIEHGIQVDMVAEKATIESLVEAVIAAYCNLSS
ncbi:uroporphyrinogen-III synthase, partial [Candidatus Poribacteria bacterium]|nr:uroporphyrinogen-III synthase [Candidatus Poribacteria bacterium]